MVGNKKAVRGFWLKEKSTSFKAAPSGRSLGDINKGSDSRISGKRKTHLNTQRPKTKPLSKSKTRRGRVGGRLK
jgi:hypothetical protein